MATLRHALLTPSPLCCCSHALLHPRARKISPSLVDIGIEKLDKQIEHSDSTVTCKLETINFDLVRSALLTVLLPIVGLGALIFFAQRNILQSDCPNCGKSFRILKTSVKNGPQFCPYCTQPFSVQGSKFVREAASFSSGRTPTNAQQAFNELFNRGSNGKAPSGSGTIVDVEAEVTDIE
ncbi:hypothetical protein TRIUR3_09016 [Triticum urartu]|uniref:Uncharacterized protein n=1 Tax=Triticum urartu TaxID=4572 RepID=M7ZSS6_TRIUA|nr:hypothetical protein TRIUR3_09016 [Triticum urartu]